MGMIPAETSVFLHVSVLPSPSEVSQERHPFSKICFLFPLPSREDTPPQCWSPLAGPYISRSSCLSLGWGEPLLAGGESAPPWEESQEGPFKPDQERLGI